MKRSPVKSSKEKQNPHEPSQRFEPEHLRFISVCHATNVVEIGNDPNMSEIISTRVNVKQGTDGLPKAAKKNRIYTTNHDDSTPDKSDSPTFDITKP